MVLLEMAVAAVIAVAAANEGQWLAVAVFSPNVVSSLAVRMQRRPRRTGEE